MTDWTKTFEKEVEDLRRVRDELKVQMNLAGKEAKDSFADLEKQWEQLEAKARVVGREAEASLEDVGDAAKELLSRVQAGYKRIRDLL